MKYTQLTKKERYDLELLMQEYSTQKMVAEMLWRSRSTISRELRRNKGEDGLYCSEAAISKTAERRKRIIPTKFTALVKELTCIDGLKGFPEAISTVFSKSEIQLCIVHMIRNSLKYVSYKDYKAVVADLKPIYKSQIEEEARHNMELFAAKWDSKYPAISQIWKKNWELIKTFFAQEDIRKVIYTTNAIESINNSVRKIIRNRGAFPNNRVQL